MRRLTAHSISSRLGPGKIISVLALAAVATALSGCGAPAYHFATSASDEVVLKMPRSWALVRSGLPVGSDGTPAAAGSWVGVFDSAPQPSLQHAASTHPASPVAVVRTLVVSKSEGNATTDNDLRDLVLPVTQQARSQASATGFTGQQFSLLSDEAFASTTAHGVHLVFSYVIDDVPEVFDQVAVTDARKTRLHLLLIHCTKSCYLAQQQAISATVRSFTVKIP